MSTQEAITTRDEEACEVIGSSDMRQAQISIRIWPGAIMTVHVFSCAACGKVVYDSCQYYGVPLIPNRPDNWTIVKNWGNEIYYCPDHAIKNLLFVDNREVKNEHSRIGRIS